MLLLDLIEEFIFFQGAAEVVTWNHRVIGVDRNLWRSSVPSSPTHCSDQGQPKQVAQGCVQLGFNISKGEDFTMFCICTCFLADSHYHRQFKKTSIPVAQIKLHCLSSQLSQFLTEHDQILRVAVPVHEHNWTEGADCY